MLPKSIENQLNSFHGKEIYHIQSVDGGSINEAFRYSVEGDDFFVKCNNQVPGIIAKELDGLKAIAKLDCIATPEIITFEKIDDYEVLVLPFISAGLKTPNAWENFGEQLALMHKQPAHYFGWHQSNFIGNLHQSNEDIPNFIDFFINQRLLPQIELAQKNAYLSTADIGLFEQLFQKLNEILPDAKPSLVHGDLWSGNFMIGENEKPYLIDPSIHYNFRETDIAFTHLFGGFDTKFYETYNHHCPLEPDFQNRISLYNIYPLLIHMNLFGSAYYGSVISNLKQYVG
ncbi:fructosamine kinase family protein [Marivirga sp.]|uniref:fructosamine kinase family protein n=1 Tax=Marivirga sp. TaxID=2018662 RepID=UPI002D80B32F|nr:fructosamine kinase family protein [Marivirga sp.]HET8858359.1 fructosamine kinase family protein [Marivirga sp.]